MNGINNFIFILISVYVLFLLITIARIILANHQPLKTYTYILLLIGFPIGGLLIYYLASTSFNKKTRYKNRNLQANEFLKQNQPVVSKEPKDIPKKIQHLFLNNEHTRFTTNNFIQYYSNGDQKLQQLKIDLQEAKKHIHLEYFTIKANAEAWSEIFSILQKKAKEGVKVRILFDDLGSSVNNKIKEEMTESGIQFAVFMPILLPQNLVRGNFRDHRKLVIIDGTTGYIGGVNLGDEYFNSKNNHHWRDTHLKIEGDAVKQMQLLFFSNWLFSSKEIITDLSPYLCTCETKGNANIAIIGSNASEDKNSILEGYMSCINAAKERVWLHTPYFLPNESLIETLSVTAKSGVDVRLILPETSDSMMVNYACRSYIKQLLQNDIKVYFYNKGMMHAKTMLVDNDCCTIGTFNLDYRSLYLNDEVNAFIYDKNLAKQLENSSLNDLKNCSRIQLNDWEKRPFKQQVLESIFRLVSPIM